MPFAWPSFDVLLACALRISGILLSPSGLLSSLPIGDLPSYRDPNQALAPSGLVCGFISEQEVLVESLMGAAWTATSLARTSTIISTTNTCVYSHRLRNSHQLRDFAASELNAAAKSSERANTSWLKLPSLYLE